MTLYHLVHLPIVHMTGLLLLAVLLGGLVGWERELHERPAGLRTHILVCVGSTLITLASNAVPSSGGRIAAQIVTGIGFLGAGTILRENGAESVRGLTTAASIWVIAGVGISVGYGGIYAQIAVVGTLIILFTLTVLNRLEDTLNRHRRRQELGILFTQDGGAFDKVSRLLDDLHGKGVQTRDLRLEQNGGRETMRIRLRMPRGIPRGHLDPLLSVNPDIAQYEWID